MSFPNSEKFVFNDEYGGMVLTLDDGFKQPCVNWYEHEMHEVVTLKLDSSSETKLHRGAIRASFVAALTQAGLIISAAFVHPLDKYKGNKERGRTIAAMRLGKSIRELEWENIGVIHVKNDDGVTEKAISILFANKEIPAGLVPITTQFMLTVYRRLEKLNGKPA